MLSAVIIFVLVLLSALIAAYAQFNFKKGVPKFSFNFSGIIATLLKRQVLFGLCLYVLSLAIYLSALKFGDLSFVYPVFASSFIFVILIAKFKLNEPITARRAAGILIIALGIGLVALSS